MGAANLTLRRAPSSERVRVLALRAAIIVTLLVAWEAVSASGLLFRDVVPSLRAIGRAIVLVL